MATHRIVQCGWFEKFRLAIDALLHRQQQDLPRKHLADDAAVRLAATLPSSFLGDKPGRSDR